MSEQEREREEEGWERWCNSKRLNSMSSEKAAAPVNDPCDARNVSRLESDYSYRYTPMV